MPFIQIKYLFKHRRAPCLAYLDLKYTFVCVKNAPFVEIWRVYQFMF